MKLHRTITFLFLYRHNTWSLILREATARRVFEGRVMRNVFGPERQDTEEDEGNCFTRSFTIFLPHQILMVNHLKHEMGGAYGMHGREENAYKVLDGKPEGMKPLRRPMLVWEVTIEMDFMG
jgi:hypothetical protein